MSVSIEGKDEKSEQERTIHVKGLNKKVTNEDLQGFFGKFGQINRININDAHHFCYIVFEDQESAAKAASNAGGETEIGKLTVEHYVPKSEKPTNEPNPFHSTLHISNLPYKVKNPAILTELLQNKFSLQKD